MEDLIKMYAGDSHLQRQIKELNLKATNGKYSKGDIITFYGGFTGDIFFKSEITGFDDAGDIYVLWDYYWLPIKDNDKRKIKLWHE